VVPTKCPVKRKLECVCLEADQDIEQNVLHGSDATIHALDLNQGYDSLNSNEVSLDGEKADSYEVALGTPMNQKCAASNVVSTFALHGRRKLSKAPLVVTDVRRSIRLEGKFKGFKCDTCNPEKNCFCCAVDPPNLSGKAIRSLGRDFCKIPTAKITDEGLQKKPLAKKSAGAAHVGRATKKESKSNENELSKKIRKE
jgi:hypothetical protein